MDITLYNDDCFNVFPEIEDNTVNLFVLDLPYNQTACNWDKDIIPLDEMWKHIKRIMKPNGIVIHFCTAKFGYRLIHSNPKWFRYDLIWKKSRKVGFLSANKMPLRQHENIYLFKPEQGTYNPQKTKGKPNKNKGGIEQKDLGMIEGGYYRGEGKKPFKRMAAHPTERHPTSIIEHENMYVFKPEQGTYNPQKTKGKPYICMEGKKNKDDCYNLEGGKVLTENKGDRHPTSIIDHENLYVFSNQNEYDEENEQLKFNKNKILVDYSKKVFEYIGKTKKQIMKDVPQSDHFFRWSRGNFNLPTETTYNKLIELYKLDEMPDFIPYETLKEKWDGKKETDTLETTYNPQKTEGKPYTLGKVKPKNADLYGKQLGIDYKRENKGDRHPTSIIDHENLYVFSDACNDDLDISRNKDLRQYAQKVKDYIGKTKTEIVKDIGQTIDHFFRITSSQFAIPTEKTYNKLIELYKLDEMPEFIPYETLNKIWIEHNETTYNPQKTKGKPYLIKEHKLEKQSVYGATTVPEHMNETGDRHPGSLIDYDGDSILIYKNPHKTIHRTQKPVELCEWLIKTYSNEGDTVMDFTMGSGTVAIAAHNTKRKFIGVEKDPEIYKLAEKRIEESCID